MAAPGFPFPSRLAFVRAAMSAAGLDALVVTHPPNIFYLSGFSGTAGALVVDAQKATLVVDSRYLTAARALREEHPGLSTLGVVLSAGTIDETLVQMLRARERPRIGIEAASMPVLRFNRLSSSLAADAPPVRGIPLPVLVPTERFVERSRIVKDERGDRDSPRRRAQAVARCGEVLPGLIRPGRSEADRPLPSTPPCATPAFSARRSRPSSRPGPTARCRTPGRAPRTLQAGDPVVLDFGGVYDGYCVDLTRTVQLAPSTTEFRRLFAAVADAQRAAIDAVRPGAAVGRSIARPAQALERHGLAEAFGHGTGHGLGLEVHEEPRIAKAGSGAAGRQSSSRAWCSRSSRARTYRASAACASKTTCWWSRAAAR